MTVDLHADLAEAMRLRQDAADAGDSSAFTVARVRERRLRLRLVEINEAADSMVKASTPEPFSKSKTSNWVARGGGLPPYIQHIAHDLVEKRGKTESNAIQMAIGICKRWCRGGGNVDATTKAAACKAVAEWEKLKAGAHLKEANFNPLAHPRTRSGEFRDVLGKLASGKSASLPSGITVTRRGDTYHLKGPRGAAAAPITASSPENAADMALTYDRTLRGAGKAKLHALDLDPLGPTGPIKGRGRAFDTLSPQNPAKRSTARPAQRGGTPHATTASPNYQTKARFDLDPLSPTSPRYAHNQGGLAPPPPRGMRNINFKGLTTKVMGGPVSGRVAVTPGAAWMPPVAVHVPSETRDLNLKDVAAKVMDAPAKAMGAPVSGRVGVTPGAPGVAPVAVHLPPNTPEFGTRNIMARPAGPTSPADAKAASDVKRAAMAAGTREKVGGVTVVTPKFNPPGTPPVGDLSGAKLSDLASMIRADWANVDFAAAPYLDALDTLDSTNDSYGADSGASVAAYFMSNASAWHGPVAKAVKAELTKRLRGHYGR